MTIDRLAFYLFDSVETEVSENLILWNYLSLSHQSCEITWAILLFHQVYMYILLYINLFLSMWLKFDALVIGYDHLLLQRTLVSMEADSALV